MSIAEIIEFTKENRQFYKGIINTHIAECNDDITLLTIKESFECFSLSPNYGLEIVDSSFIYLYLDIESKIKYVLFDGYFNKEVFQNKFKVGSKVELEEYLNVGI